jgi:hypothetical protein
VTSPRGTVKDQILLPHLDRKREFVGLTLWNGSHCAPGALVTYTIKYIKIETLAQDVLRLRVGLCLFDHFIAEGIGQGEYRFFKVAIIRYPVPAP